MRRAGAAESLSRCRTPAATGFNYTSQLSGQPPRREDLLRLDYNVTQKIRVFGHWINNASSTVVPYGSFVLGPNVPITNIHGYPTRATASRPA